MLCCENPDCDKPAHKKYQDTAGNELRLCREHYYTILEGVTCSNCRDSNRPDFDDVWV